jgi:hypothetical protein
MIIAGGIFKKAPKGMIPSGLFLLNFRHPGFRKVIYVQTSGKSAYLQTGSFGQPIDLAPAPMTA